MLAEFSLKSMGFWVVGNPVQDCPGVGILNSSMEKFITRTVVFDSARSQGLAVRACLAFLLLFLYSYNGTFIKN